MASHGPAVAGGECGSSLGRPRRRHPERTVPATARASANGGGTATAPTARPPMPSPSLCPRARWGEAEPDTLPPPPVVSTAEQQAEHALRIARPTHSTPRGHPGGHCETRTAPHSPRRPREAVRVAATGAPWDDPGRRRRTRGRQGGTAGVVRRCRAGFARLGDPPCDPWPIPHPRRPLHASWPPVVWCDGRPGISPRAADQDTPGAWCLTGQDLQRVHCQASRSVNGGLSR